MVMGIKNRGARVARRKPRSPFDKPFKTRRLQFTDRNEAKNWIINNALGRRNLTEDQKSYLRGKRYNETKRADGGHGDQKSGGHCVRPIASEAIASVSGVVERTVRRDAQFASALDTLAETTGRGTRDAILSGDLRVNRKDVVAVAGLAPEKQKKAVKGGAEGIKKAVAPVPREISS